MDSFINLLGIEYQISKIYKDLFNVESHVNMKNINDSFELFMALIDELKFLLIKEEKILSSLSDNDIEIINDLLSKGTVVDVNDNDSFTKLINERIDFRINGNNSKLDNDRSSVILNYIMDDFNNYYLSFVDEWIRKEKNHKVKEYLFLKKYQYLFLLSRKLERNKIKDSFATEESVYSSSYFMAQFYRVDDEEYNDLRIKYAISRANSSINSMHKLINNYDEKNRYLFEVIYKLFSYSLRASLILLTDDEREEILEDIIEEDDTFEKEISLIFKDELNNIINKDKERHKLLSLNI